MKFENPKRKSPNVQMNRKPIKDLKKKCFGPKKLKKNKNYIYIYIYIISKGLLKKKNA